MNYLDEYDLVDEDAAGYPGSSPRSLNGGIDHFFASSPYSQDGLDPADELALYDVEVDNLINDLSDIDEDNLEPLEEDHDFDFDSFDDDEPRIAYYPWDDMSGEDNSSSRSTSPIESLHDPASPGTDEDEDGADDGEIGSDPPSPGDSVQELEARYDHFRYQLNNLDESRARIAAAVRELTQRSEESTRFWENQLRSSLGHREPILGDRVLNMSGSAREQHRHHPYRMLPPLVRGGSGSGDASRRSETRNNNQRGSSTIHHILDELVEVEVEGPQTRRTTRPPNPARTESTARNVSVIDLTEEPDSPAGPLHHDPSHTRARPPNHPPLPLPSIGAAHRNPRRQMSLNHRTPSLTRSDGSLLGNRPAPPPAEVIDLTMDDDTPSTTAPQNENQNARRGNAQRNPPPGHPQLTLPRIRNGRDAIDLLEEESHHTSLFGLLHRGTSGGSAAAAATAAARAGNIFGVGILHRIGGLFSPHGPFAAGPDVQFVGLRTATNAAATHNPLAENLPNFNYTANGYNNGGGGSTKPIHTPPARPREGFSRATAEDLVFVCPGCEEELAYDPDGDDPGQSTKGKGSPNRPAAKKARSRKDREEHYFWAVKECGHVYCKKCYEHRKPTKLGPKTSFRSDPAHPRKVLCAVEACTSDVSSKPAWVGLFL